MRFEKRLGVTRALCLSPFWRFSPLRTARANAASRAPPSNAPLRYTLLPYPACGLQAGLRRKTSLPFVRFAAFADKCTNGRDGLRWCADGWRWFTSWAPSSLLWVSLTSHLSALSSRRRHRPPLPSSLLPTIRHSPSPTTLRCGRGARGAALAAHCKTCVWLQVSRNFSPGG